MYYTCDSCGDRLALRDVAAESKVYVEGTAQTRVRRVARYCRKCHDAHKRQRQQAMQQARAELWDDLTPEERAGYLARKAAAQ